MTSAIAPQAPPRRWRPWGAAAVAVVVAVAVTTALVVPVAGSALVVSLPIDAPEVLVSLASHEWERLPACAALGRAYPSAIVLLTVPQSVTAFNCHDCAHRTERLVEGGIAATRVRSIRLTSGGTHGEAIATRSFLEANGLRRIIVVTSPYHTRRALATFVKVLSPIHATVGVMPATETSPARPDQWWAAHYDRAYVRYEWAALLYYSLRYGVSFVSPSRV